MKITTTMLAAACLCVALVSSVPLRTSGFQSQALDKLMASETSDESPLRNKRTIGVLRELFPDISKDANPEASENNQVVNEADDGGQAESANNEVRVQFADDVPQNDANTAAANEGELAPLDDIEASDDENRNKRFLNFGLGSGGNGGGAGGGSGGGSGNFLFDIIRQAADSAARAAGTVYRVVAGTQSLGLGLSASRDLGPAPAGGNPIRMPPGASRGGANNTTSPPLVAGSGSSSSGAGSSGGDPADGAPTPGPQTEAVPGPVTRLFVIANRGISNLVQDLILRLAATSERIVNFKARLITSII